MSFTPEELEHYARQILVRDFGGQAQAKLKAAHIGIIGLGGIGSPVALYLAAAGIGHLTLFEDDVISRSNLHRQVLYDDAAIGEMKLKEASKRLQALNPHIKINPQARFSENSKFDGDLLIDGSDQIETRRKVNECAARLGVKLLSASLAQWEGQIAYFDLAHAKGCYQCLYPDGEDAALPSCSEAGVIGPIAGVIGTMAALEAVKIISGNNPLSPSTMLLYDGIYRESREIKINARKYCPICSPNSG